MRRESVSQRWAPCQDSTGHCLLPKRLAPFGLCRILTTVQADITGIQTSAKVPSDPLIPPHLPVTFGQRWKMGSKVKGSGQQAQGGVSKDTKGSLEGPADVDVAEDIEDDGEEESRGAR